MEWDMFGKRFCALKPNPYLVHLSFIPTNDLNHKMPIKCSSGAFFGRKATLCPPSSSLAILEESVMQK